MYDEYLKKLDEAGKIRNLKERSISCYHNYVDKNKHWKDWEECRDIIWGKNEPLNTDVMKGVDETAFLTTITLYTSYFAKTATTCKKKDVLGLEFEAYQAK